MRNLLIILFAPLSLAVLTGCLNTQPNTQPELLIYSGVTMIKPMSEIAEIIEEEEGVKITFTKGGSGNLLKSIEANHVGDLYLPGSDSYITQAQEAGLVTDAVLVGHNQAVMMVQAGNPKNITADLENLAKADYYVVIGNPDSGSIGKETKRILENKGIFDEVIQNARQLTTDSKDLVSVLKNDDADVVINWYAVSVWPENSQDIDTLPIDEAYATPKKLVLGLLASSNHPEIARKFMDYAVSPQGQQIFAKYGLD